jgi:hypothetical protein
MEFIHLDLREELIEKKEVVLREDLIEEKDMIRGPRAKG